jgi:hypothetical protein
MTKHTVVTIPELEPHLESLAIIVGGLTVPYEPAVSFKAVQHPAAVVRLVATPVGLLRLAAHLLAHLKDAPSPDQHDSFERICADDSAALVVDVVDTMPLPSSSPMPSRMRVGLWAAAMTGLWVSSLLLWAIGLYASVMWVGARLMSWW